MSAQHTPAPWWSTLYGVRDSGGFIVATTWPSSFPDQEERHARETAQREADVRLIVAAPDLLAAAQQALAKWHEVAGSLPQSNAIENADWCEFQALRGAVAKATGSPT